MEENINGTNPFPMHEKASKSWKKYVDKEFVKEEQIDFSEDELGYIKEVITKLDETDEAYKWHSLGTEYHRMFVRGYATRKNVVADIVESVLETFTFIEEYNVKELLQSRLPNHDVYHSAWPSYIAGEDNFGHFVNFEKLTDMSVPALEKFEKKDLFRFRIQHIEAIMRLKEQTCLKLNRRICRYIFILDLKGFSVTKHLTPRVKSLLAPVFAISGDRYPESLWSMYLVNTPSLFRLAWNAINKIVDPVVRAKVKILGGPKEFIPLMISQGIPIESIPTQIGGEAKVTLASDLIDSLIECDDGVVPAENFVSFSYFEAALQPDVPREEVIINKASNDIMPTETDLERIKERLKVLAESPNQLHFEAEEDPDDPVIFEGYLEKRGWYNKGWKRRYFILKDSGLYYYSTKPVGTQKPKGKIDLLLVSKINPLVGFFRTRGTTRWSKNTTMKRSRKIPLPSMTKPSFNRHAVLGTFKSFSLNKSSDKTNLTLPIDANVSSLPILTARGSIATNESDEYLMGFDLVTPYRTYHLRLGEREKIEEDGEALVHSWAENIGEAQQQRMIELEEQMKEEVELHKGFLERKVRRGFGFFPSKYRKRYFVLTTQRLYYYSDINTNVGATLKGKIDLKKVQNCALKEAPEEVESYPVDFSIKLGRRNIMPMRADEPEVAALWVEFINNAVTEYEKSIELMKQRKIERREKRRLESIMVDEETEEALVKRNNSVTSVDSWSNLSVDGVSESLKSFFSDALSWGKKNGAIKEEDTEGAKRKLPSPEEMFENAKLGMKSSVKTVVNTASLTKTRRKFKTNKEDINIEEVELE